MSDSSSSHIAPRRQGRLDAKPPVAVPLLGIEDVPSWSIADLDAIGLAEAAEVVMGIDAGMSGSAAVFSPRSSDGESGNEYVAVVEDADEVEATDVAAPPPTPPAPPAAPPPPISGPGPLGYMTDLRNGRQCGRITGVFNSSVGIVCYMHGSK